MTKPLLTVEQICERYHVSDRRARDIVRGRGLRVLRPGRAWLFGALAETAFTEASGRSFPDPSAGQVPRHRASRPKSAESALEKALELAPRGSRKTARRGRR